ncbi:unnamed protein product [Prorocentrum cordatum]|uniref:CASP-like protein n=1 Tax=Prorocentrum cordatum TaxID=2364126 RepID=A0ABN9VIG5_9DINO|nr:unnamed protein product [Polarella glacialis]
MLKRPLCAFGPDAVWRKPGQAPTLGQCFAPAQKWAAEAGACAETPGMKKQIAQYLGTGQEPARSWASLRLKAASEPRLFRLALGMAAGGLAIALSPPVLPSNLRAVVAVVTSGVLVAYSFRALPRTLAKSNFYMFLISVAYLDLSGPLHWSFRRAFVLTSAVQAVASGFDLLIIQRWNIAIGLSDEAAYLFGDAACQSVAVQMALMPGAVLTSRLCPRGAEATVYAIAGGRESLGIASREDWVQPQCLSGSPRDSKNDIKKTNEKLATLQKNIDHMNRAYLYCTESEYLKHSEHVNLIFFPSNFTIEKRTNDKLRGYTKFHFARKGHVKDEGVSSPGNSPAGSPCKTWAPDADDGPCVEYSMSDSGRNL